MAGFWKYAQEDPDYLAIVDPDGTEYTAGDVLARANQVVHALRALGLEKGDTRRRGAAERSPPDARVPRRAAGRLVLRADQLPAVAARDRVHPPGLRREGVRQSTSASPIVASAAAEEAGIPRRRPARARQRSRASVVRRGRRPAADDAARRPRRRRGDALHVGHHRQAEGREAHARRHRPRHERRAVHVPLGLFGITHGERQRAPLHLAELPHRGHDVRRQRAALEAHASCSWTSGIPEETLRLIERYRCTHTHMVPTQFIRMLQLPERREAQVRRVVDEVGDPRRGAVPGRR